MTSRTWMQGMSQMRRDMDPLVILGEIGSLEGTYPGFREWYLTKVVPGLAVGTRAVIAEVPDGRVAGVVIAKREGGERKLCTVWRREGAGQRDTALRMVRAAMEWMAHVILSLPCRPTGSTAFCLS